MVNVAVIGCGIVGAMVAYELSQRAGVAVTGFESQAPAQGATGAALGLCMGVISRKTKGRAWALRHHSLQRYATLLPELAQTLGRPIPHNRQGLLKLCFDAAEIPQWQRLAHLRHSQGYRLDLLTPHQLESYYPPLNRDGIQWAIASPQDWQIQPQALTQALVEGATAQGGRWLMPVTVAAVVPLASGKVRVEWGTGSDLFDRVVISAGLDSSPLIPASPPLLDPPLVLEPVLGQGARLRLPLQGTPLPQPVMTGHDIHLVPLGAGEYGLGATVEFAPGREPGGGWIADGAQWDELWRRAIDLWPLLAEAEVLETWAGARPRPVGRSAPVIEGLRGGAIVVATGHYRNGVLLAPATAARAIDLLALPPLGDRI